ncbi:MAG: hypothetical protein HYY68_01880 [Thaumarchaeota archaeon]|nr:hypothetical protein [Nitrososphaerota archaeon]MBI3022461.1 hypothetical protein [Nitrososphaerota archaeon]
MKSVAPLPKVQYISSEASAQLICDKCHAGQMIEYERKVASRGKEIILAGRRCERCGFTQLDSDDDIWSAVGL